MSLLIVDILEVSKELGN